MPALTMRGRYIMREYWSDSDLFLRLSADERELYVGLWMLADDAGYVAWDLHRVGAELYPYRSPAWRAKRLGAWLEALGVEHARLLGVKAKRVAALPPSASAQSGVGRFALVLEDDAVFDEIKQPMR